MATRMNELPWAIDGLEDTGMGRLMSAVRRLLETASTGAYTEDAAHAAAQALTDATAELASNPAPPGGVAPSVRFNFIAKNPISGLLNAVAPPVTHDIVDGLDGGVREVRGAVNFGHIYEGPPGWVHGGIVSAVLDDALGVANGVAGMGAVTGTLTVRFIKPTPLNTDLRLEARYTHSEGRKVHAWAGLYRSDELLAEAHGLFIRFRASS
jgi:acyl-coenzyme A thioesterase PaaI-like protein